MWTAVHGVLSAPVGAQRAGAERLERRFAPSPDKPVVVGVTVGDVVVQAWPRPELVVAVEPRPARGAEASRLAVEIDERADAIFVAAQQRAGPPDRSLRADVSIRAPAGTPIRAIEVLDGHVVLDGLRGTVAATVKQGHIDGVRLAGVVRLETTMGDVRVRDAELAPDGLLRLRAFNGNVSLHLASAPAHARILALSFNGKVASSIPLTMREGWGPTFGEATLGNGAPVVSLDAVYGDVTIRVGR